MGRWAQARRRGGGELLVNVPAASNIVVDIFSGFWRITWESASDPTYWEVQVQHDTGGGFHDFIVYTPTGSARSVDTSLPEQDHGQCRIRPVMGATPGEWSAWVDMNAV